MEQSGDGAGLLRDQSMDLKGLLNQFLLNLQKIKTRQHEWQPTLKVNSGLRRQSFSAAALKH